MKDFFSQSQQSKLEYKENKPLGRLVVKALSSILILVLIGMLLFHGQKVFFSPLRRVDVSGNSILSKETVVKYMGLKENDSWLGLDPFVLSQRLARHVWIKTAMVHRNLRLGIDVYITERQPVAYLKAGEQLYLLCEDHLILNYEPVNSGEWDLPVIISNSADQVAPGEKFQDVGVDRALVLLQTLRDNPTLNASSISEIHIGDPLNMELVTAPDGIRVKLGYQKLPEKIRNLSLAMPVLSKMKKRLRYIDLRYSTGVVIKRK